ncbi:bifunctional 4-hydroxy-2-oxoglutarate aldolase/2-dehydro-3-deoxy-phosphogluconate aldolase [Algisphaera agarilytica]|uniref:2-dehydro-3-deoxyphosphogluconate aldolase/(4S)-4-hydroxy-2-oxoglutarate aldolase n=1 Tax=Algisphaera agarilytica TaxID=1385975 RepID=A0A7X0LJZ1_9BACT|nr:bifunctional 4-hydroxy-2-oxoglutarate aldolase/2-dehydro-3-deoxy-phosphogluconate aldolase [Algisphaera agarilytica]MBB6429362.1 2-dehydro-3-deoxyphosphogluconate aldolase/(4S)-4-hydroxy-2-oxoglutarate aldolase [Algisphaera agarilytica]
MDLAERFESAVARCPVVGIFRWPEPVDVVPVVRALGAGGLGLVEVTMNTPGVCESIRAVRKARTDEDTGLIGAGTVLDVESAERAVEAGAEFLVTPTTELPVVQWAVERGVPVLPGAFTPSEALAAWRAGATAVKVFPAEDLGPRYIGNVLAPLDMLRLVPTGHLTLDDLPDYFRAGATAVGVGGTMIDPDLVRRGDWEGLTERAKVWCEAANLARGHQ